MKAGIKVVNEYWKDAMKEGNGNLAGFFVTAGGLVKNVGKVKAHKNGYFNSYQMLGQFA